MVAVAGTEMVLKAIKTMLSHGWKLVKKRGREKTRWRWSWSWSSEWKAKTRTGTTSPDPPWGSDGAIPTADEPIRSRVRALLAGRGRAKDPHGRDQLQRACFTTTRSAAVSMGTLFPSFIISSANQAPSIVAAALPGQH